jgi:hypothetical protein
LLDRLWQTRHQIWTRKPQYSGIETGTRFGSITDGGHQLVGRDRNWNILAYFDKKSGTTRDRAGNLVCAGNALASFITKAAGR